VPRIVITLPAYRAERTLAQTVADIPAGVADRLILVDDASPDNTAQLARELGIEVHVHPQNLGYGGNQKTCYIEALASGADVVVLLHPDYQYEPKAVPLLIAPILAGDADMTFGSRFAGLADPIGGGMPLYRYVGNRLTTIAENLMLGSRFSELHSGLRAYTRRCLLSLPILRYSNDFLFDSQLLIDAVTTGQRVVEVPIPTRYTKESSSINVGSSLDYIVKSLAYCSQAVASRGRRGRRSPLLAGATFSATTHEGDATGTGSSKSRDDDVEAAAAALLNMLDGYFVSANHLLTLGSGTQTLERLAIAQGLKIAPTADSEAIQIVAILDPDGALPHLLSELEHARPLLDTEVLVGVITTVAASDGQAHVAPSTLSASLHRIGLSPVAWRWADGRRRLVVVARAR